ncbi:MAG: hypothetical protein ACRD3W_14740, partial [Terriglobales bacterium]
MRDVIEIDSTAVEKGGRLDFYPAHVVEVAHHQNDEQLFIVLKLPAGARYFQFLSAETMIAVAIDFGEYSAQSRRQIEICAE